MTSKLTTALIAGSLLLAPQTAMAKDYIKKVGLTPDGIDLVPIQVKAGGSKFQSIKPQNHRFGLRIYAKTKSGKRIVGAKLGMHNGVEYYESSGNLWSHRLAYRDVGSGSLKEMNRSFSYNIPTTKLRWKGKSAVQRCNQLLDAKVASGMSRHSALAKTWTTSAKVYFQVQVLATTKAKAKKNKWKMKHTTAERKTAYYTVNVKCVGKGNNNA